MTAFIQTLFTWLELVSLAFCIAVLVFRIPGFIPLSPVLSDRDDVFTPGLWRIFGTAVAAIIVVSCSELLLHAGDMNAGQGRYFVTPISPILLGTDYRAVWLIRIAAALLLFIVIITDRRQNDSSAMRYFMLGLSLVLAWTQSSSGHDAVEGNFTSKKIIDMLHLLAASVWGGGLLVLSVVVLPSLVKRGDLVMMARISRRFSRVSGLAIILILVTAVFHLWHSVGSLQALWKTSYGLTVFAKIGLLYFLILLYAFNRFVSVPVLEQLTGVQVYGPGVIGQYVSTAFDRFRDYLSVHIAYVFVKVVLAEAVLMIAVFLCSALLRHETPAVKLERLEHLQNTITAGYTIMLGDIAVSNGDKPEKL